MSSPCIRVMLVGEGFSTDLVNGIKTSGQPVYCETGFEFIQCADDGIGEKISEFRPHCIVTLEQRHFHGLFSQPLEVRRRWIHCHGESSPQIADRIHMTFMESVVGPNRFPNQPLVSVFTPIYKTQEKVFLRALASLRSQTYTNWEWVLYIDGPESCHEAGPHIECAVNGDPRIRSYVGRNSGRIGEVKRNAAALCRGKILVELDHDDELLPNCLEDILAAHLKYPEAGFFYSHCAEMRDGKPEARYGEGFGMGYGSYRTEFHDNKRLDVSVSAPINAATMRYITGVPNHVRAWTSKAYWEAGGHNPAIPVCDDYEIVLRTFLTTRMVRVNRCGYIQHFGDSNSQDPRRPEIQRLCLYFSYAYTDRVSVRIKELGGDDFMMRNGNLIWDAQKPDDAKALNLEYYPSVELEQTQAHDENSKLAIITACSRPENILKILESIPDAAWVEWIIVLDYGIDFDIKRIGAPRPVTLLKNSDPVKRGAGGQHVKNIGLEYAIKNGFSHVYFLDDDNLVHPSFWEEFKSIKSIPDGDLIMFDQELHEHGETLVRVPQPHPMQIDQGQYIVNLSTLGALRIPHSYDGDGRFAQAIAHSGCVSYVPKTLSYYNKIAI